MKILYSTGGSTPQSVQVNYAHPSNRAKFDKWRSHAVFIDPQSGFAPGFSGQIYGKIGATLKDGNDYYYFTEVNFNTIGEAIAWGQAWSTYYINGHPPSYFGEGWNKGGRYQFTAKVLQSDFSSWYYSH